MAGLLMACMALKPVLQPARGHLLSPFVTVGLAKQPSAASIHRKGGRQQDVRMLTADLTIALMVAASLTACCLAPLLRSAYNDRALVVLLLLPPQPAQYAASACPTSSPSLPDGHCKQKDVPTTGACTMSLKGGLRLVACLTLP